MPRQETAGVGDRPDPAIEANVAWVGSEAVTAEPPCWVGPPPRRSVWLIDYLDAPAEGALDDRDAKTFLFETDSLHTTVPTAQALPEVAVVRVEGTLKPGDDLDLYRMPLPPGFRSMRIGLNVSQPSQESPEHLILFDEAGQVIDTHAVDLKSGRLLMVVQESGSLVDQALFVGIYRPHSADWQPPQSREDFTPPPVGGGRDAETAETPDGDRFTDPTNVGTPYDLSFTTDQDTADGPSLPALPTNGGGTAGTVPDSEDPRLAVQPALGGGAGQTSAVPRSSSDGVVAFQVVVSTDDRPPRPSPLRSATPRAGIFTTGPATHPIDRRMAAVVDMSLVDLPARSDPPNGEDPPLIPIDDEPAVSASALRFPGGLPLEGAPAAPHRSTTDFAPLVWELRKSGPAISSQRTHQTPRPVIIQPVTDRDTVSIDRGAGAQAAVRAGFSLAYGLAFTFLLPDLTARFQAILTRTRPRLRKRMLRRLFGGKVRK